MRRLALGLGLFLVAAAANASMIGIYFDPLAGSCQRSLQPGSSLSIYVIADLFADAANDGITGAELRLTGMPTDWFVAANPNPAANVNVGNITIGSNLAFPSCQTGDRVLLYTISGLAPTAGNDIVLRIEPHSLPSNPGFPCPLLTLCDAPAFTYLCVEGTCAIINRVEPLACCTFGVEAQTWSNVKALYVD